MDVLFEPLKDMFSFCVVQNDGYFYIGKEI